MTSNVLERMSLRGKVALITGGGQGIGEGFCYALGEIGAKVAVNDCVADRANRVAANLREGGVDAIPVVADVTRREEVVAMLKVIVDKWGKLDIAVNNAGIGKNTPAEDITDDEWNQILNTNLSSVFICCQEEARYMLQAGYGKIINTASMSSVIIPHPQKQAAYNTSKAAVVQLTKSLACEWASRGIRVNCISPGIVQTPMIETPELRPLVKEWINQIPVQRFAQIADLQGAIVYMASELSDYMIGHNLIIDGGQSVW